jgi:hypothetical protein
VATPTPAATPTPGVTPTPTATPPATATPTASAAPTPSPTALEVVRSPQPTRLPPTGGDGWRDGGGGTGALLLLGALLTLGSAAALGWSRRRGEGSAD